MAGFEPQMALGLVNPNKGMIRVLPSETGVLKV